MCGSHLPPMEGRFDNDREPGHRLRDRVPYYFGDDPLADDSGCSGIDEDAEPCNVGFSNNAELDIRSLPARLSQCCQMCNCLQHRRHSVYDCSVRTLYVDRRQVAGVSLRDDGDFFQFEDSTNRSSGQSSQDWMVTDWSQQRPLASVPAGPLPCTPSNELLSSGSGHGGHDDTAAFAGSSPISHAWETTSYSVFAETQTNESSTAMSSTLDTAPSSVGANRLLSPLKPYGLHTPPMVPSEPSDWTMEWFDRIPVDLDVMSEGAVLNFDEIQEMFDGKYARSCSEMQVDESSIDVLAAVQPIQGPGPTSHDDAEAHQPIDSAPTPRVVPRASGLSKKRGCVRQYQCRICDRRLSDRKGWKRHHQAIHTTERPYACVCGKSFPRTDHLQRHREKCRLYDTMGDVSFGNT